MSEEQTPLAITRSDQHAHGGGHLLLSHFYHGCLFTTLSLNIARSRVSIEEKKGADIEEILLCDNAGRIYEGLSSNFFAIEDGVLYTAPDNVVLCGTMRHAVIDLARQHSIDVRFEYPCVATIARWDAAFVCSTSRQLLPVGRVDVRLSSTETILLHTQSPIVKTLSSRLSAYMLERAFRL
jgi:branched-subunit amino acid aminotransferase/4-amino-4-deoxychorismate lyase